jgi:hypothetical protein
MIFSNNTSIMRVSASGGDPIAVTTVDKARKESAHMLPWFLPDGIHFLYLRIFGGNDSRTGIYVGSVEAKPEEQNATRLMAAQRRAPATCCFCARVC